MEEISDSASIWYWFDQLPLLLICSLLLRLKIKLVPLKKYPLFAQIFWIVFSYQIKMTFFNIEFVFRIQIQKAFPILSRVSYRLDPEGKFGKD